MLFVQVETSAKELVFLVSDEPEDGAENLEELSNCGEGPLGSGIRVHATPAQEYLEYWNNDYCYYAGAEEKTDQIEIVAGKRDSEYRALTYLEAVRVISLL